MLDTGTKAPDFSLQDPSTRQSVQRSNFDGSPLLIVFSCNHCPYVLHILESFTAFANSAQQRGLAVALINANDTDNYPDDSPQNMVSLSQSYGFDFPYLFDPTQQTAIAYRAACTPDFFLFDAGHRLVYRGQFDGSRPGNHIVVSGKDLRQAVDALLQGKSQQTKQFPSMGCNIKWRPGNEPEYF